MWVPENKASSVVMKAVGGVPRLDLEREETWVMNVLAGGRICNNGKMSWTPQAFMCM